MNAPPCEKCGGAQRYIEHSCVGTRPEQARATAETICGWAEQLRKGPPESQLELDVQQVENRITGVMDRAFFDGLYEGCEERRGHERRERIATACMQGILASLTSESEGCSPREVAASAVVNAVALIAELDKKGAAE